MADRDGGQQPHATDHHLAAAHRSYPTGYHHSERSSAPGDAPPTNVSRTSQHSVAARGARAAAAMPVIGFLNPATPDAIPHLLAAFRQGLAVDQRSSLGVGDGAALEEAQLLMYPSGSSQERIEPGSQSPCASSKPAANGPPMPYGPLRIRLVTGNTC
jgi:hypothetical protein